MQPQEDASTPFGDRREAGRELADVVAQLDLEEPVVVALPRGGVPVAFEVAQELGAPLDILLVRKLGAPQNPELAVGAISEDGQVILDGDTIASLGISRDQLGGTIARERLELERRRSSYRGEALPIEVRGRNVLLIDDGLATGSTAVSAARALRGRGAARIVAAFPVCPQGVERALTGEFDEIVCLRKPRQFGGVGRWYRDFSPTSDSEVVELLGAGRAEMHGTAAAVSIGAGAGISLQGDLRVPADPRGLVIFAHGSGSSRHSPRNRAVAEALNSAGFATLLLDLLSKEEEGERGHVFDVALLARRLLIATEWAYGEKRLRGLPIGYFGASTGAAAALTAAAAPESRIGAVVSRGGRPDLAADALPRVSAATLLIVGGNDREVRGLNELAAERLGGRSEVIVVPGAGHLFEESGALARVADLAANWFSSELAASVGDAASTGAQ